MPPRRRLLSWHTGRRTGVVVRWQILAGRGPGRDPVIVRGKACQGPRSRPRQGSCWELCLLVFTKLCMPLHTHPWVLASTLSMVSEVPTSRVVVLLVHCKSSRQGSCWGFASRPGKDLAGGPARLLLSGLWLSRFSSDLVFICDRPL